jgi:RNA polymerase sigma factor (sigma-70 family)
LNGESVIDKMLKICSLTSSWPPLRHTNSPIYMATSNSPGCAESRITKWSTACVKPGGSRTCRLTRWWHRRVADYPPAEESIRQERYAYLYRLIASLPPIQQEVIHLRYGQGLRPVEIAARLQQSDRAVHTLLLRTLRRLHMLYEREERKHRA